jgi:choline dehydrogenase-like flavoprotein
MRDVIVVGAGGGGSALAKELSARGLDVLVLEAGDRFAHPSREWSHLEDRANDPAFGYFRFGPADPNQPRWPRDLVHPGTILQIAAVGGTTLHYYANCPRAMPGVFHGYNGRDRDAYDRRHEFPFTYSEFVPYYEWAEATLPVATAAMGIKEEAFLDAAAKAGLHYQTGKDITRNAYRPQENAILQPGGSAGRTGDAAKLRYPHARGCTFCGYCQQGCYEPRGAPRNLTAKRSADNSWMPMALTANHWQRGGKPVTLLTNAFVTKIETDRRGSGTTARGVTWRDVTSDVERSEQAKVVVLAGGSIENPRLWLKSGLPNPNGWVGRGITEHFLDFVLAVLPRSIGASRGPASAARADFPGHGSLQQYISTPANASASALLSLAGFAPGPPALRLGADTVGRFIGPALVEAMSDVDRVMMILILTDDDVQRDNTVSLSTSSDPFGPVARVDVNGLKRSPRTVRNRNYVVRQAVRLARAAGARSVHRMDAVPTLLHIHSSMRMGARPEDSVLGPTGEARFVKRLFITDNSALSNSLGGPNPTLTTQALATRTAEQIFTGYFGGDPWVGHEAPTPSTDSRISRALAARGL